jgi:hypothetical protein
LEDKKERRDSRRAFWEQRYSLTRNMRSWEEIHHQREKRIKGFILNQVEKYIPKEKNGKPRSVKNRMQDSNYSLKQDILFRIELACCTPMDWMEHKQYHKLLRRKNGRR